MIFWRYIAEPVRFLATSCNICEEVGLSFFGLEIVRIAEIRSKIDFSEEQASGTRVKRIHREPGKERG